ncbi:MAG: MFS transporter, partial [Actinobacteria bacterium]|nr:MFS transporter [Actinomycetota bacterium]
MPTDAQDSPAPVSLRNGVFIVVIALQFVLVLVNGSTTMALPGIRDGLGATNSELQWYASLFALTFSLVLVLSGRLGDLFGTRRLLLIGFGALLASWALSAASPNIYFLLVARALQGIAGGVTAPQLSAMIQRTFNGHTRTRAFSIFLMFAGAGFMVGQLSAGALTNADLFGAGWRWAYLPFIPIGLVAWLIAAKVLPTTQPGTAGRLDITGAAVLAVVAFFLMFPLIQGRNAGWPVWILLMLACSLPLFFAFIRYEQRLVRNGGDPLVNPILFAIRSFRIGNIITLLVGLLSAAGPIYLILTIQLGFDNDPLRAAILTCP